MIIKYKYEQCPQHVRVSMFVAPSADQTFARAGEFVLRNDEFDMFMNGKFKPVFEEIKN